MNGIISVQVKPRTDNLIDIEKNPKAIYDLHHDQQVMFRGTRLTVKHEHASYGKDIYFIAEGSREKEFGRTAQPHGAIDSMYVVDGAMSFYSDYIRHLRIPAFAVRDELNIQPLHETQSRAVSTRSAFALSIAHCFIG